MPTYYLVAGTEKLLRARREGANFVLMTRSEMIRLYANPPVRRGFRAYRLVSLPVREILKATPLKAAPISPEKVKTLPAKERLDATRAYLHSQGWAYFCDRLKAGGWSLKPWGTTPHAVKPGMQKKVLAFLDQVALRKVVPKSRRPLSRPTLRWIFRDDPQESPRARRKSA